ncbi:hypothetical protein [Fictibacillus gelatini]|uniref:hypothetical protein n=1 Tax=Fictibacillus gelatini TaxID=225985 RepID=UPI0004101713|nr:hypothetical protein [Fictibacillus gelatini]
MNKQRNFHCCASCIHYHIEKIDGRTIYMCARLGYETKPTYKFNCWTPKENVKKLIAKYEKS